MVYIISFRDHRLLNWLKMNGRVKLERFLYILTANGLSEIEAGQFVNEYVTKGILLKLDDGLIKVNNFLLLISMVNMDIPRHLLHYLGGKYISHLSKDLSKDRY